MNGKEFKLEKRQKRADHPLICKRFQQCKHAPTKFQVDYEEQREKGSRACDITAHYKSLHKLPLQQQCKHDNMGLDQHCLQRI
ncbi:hypothetical protein M0R45_006464 [Rubus argutus]|uniref:Uncharacterized protein n=1 Tax=Rubus argutus TaxID=59490 RepID=A0AAW1YQP1_RUBAR